MVLVERIEIRRSLKGSKIFSLAFNHSVIIFVVISVVFCVSFVFFFLTIVVVSFQRMMESSVWLI